MIILIKILIKIVFKMLKLMNKKNNNNKKKKNMKKLVLKFTVNFTKIGLKFYVPSKNFKTNNYNKIKILIKMIMYKENFGEIMKKWDCQCLHMQNAKNGTEYLYCQMNTLTY